LTNPDQKKKKATEERKLVEKKTGAGFFSLGAIGPGEEKSKKAN